MRADPELRALFARLAVGSAIVGAMFIYGYRLETARLERVRAAEKEMGTLLDEGRAELATRETGDEGARARWSSAITSFARRVPPGDVRHGFSGELTALARAHGITQFALEEIDDRARFASESGEFGDDAHADVAYDDDTPSGESDDRLTTTVVAPFACRVAFEAPYDGFARFVRGLMRLDRVVEVREVIVERRAPGVSVEMQLVTYGSVS